MKIPIIGSTTMGLLSDAKLFVTIKGGAAADLAKSLFPSTTQDAAGNLVLEQDAGGSSGVANQIIQSVEVDSTILEVIIASVAGLFLLLLWLAVRKH